MDMEQFLGREIDDDEMPISAELQRDLGHGFQTGNVAASFAALATAVEALDYESRVGMIRSLAERDRPESFPIYAELQESLESSVGFGSRDIQSVIIDLSSAIMSLELATNGTRRDLAFLISELRQAGLSVSELED